MLQWAIVFYVISMGAPLVMIIRYGEIEVAKVLFFVFFGLAILSTILGKVTQL